MQIYSPNGQKVGDVSGEPDDLTEAVVEHDLYVVGLLQPDE